MPKLKEQDRAKKAHEVVKARVQAPNATEYRQELQQLPSRLLSCGLGQTLAFAVAKEGVPKMAGDDLAAFLAREPQKNAQGLLDEIINSGSAADYRRLSREALAYAEWLKRYAAALIPKPDKKKAKE